MNRQLDTSRAVEQAPGESANQVTLNRSMPSQPRYLLIAWILLLLLGALFLFGSLSDLLADVRSGLPSDHLDAFQAITDMSWSRAQLAAPGITHFITSLEIAYAVHELVFGVLFLIIVAIPFRKRARWAWWACWVPVLANLTYTFTIGHYGTNTLVYSLIADVALPILLLLHIPAFFGPSRHTS
jgi:hypothetical protein